MSDGRIVKPALERRRIRSSSVRVNDGVVELVPST